jgi:hypothetical protein
LWVIMPFQNTSLEGIVMTPTRTIEYRIIRRLQARRSRRSSQISAEGLILAASIVACLGVLAAFVPGLLWVILLGAFVLTLGS